MCRGFIKFKFNFITVCYCSVIREELWIDMTKEMMIDSWGKPEDAKEDVSRDKTKLRWYYGGRVTRQATTVYKYEVKLENDLVEGWKELE